MTYQRIYENIYTFPVIVSSNYVAGSKRFFDPCPELNNYSVVGMSLSYSGASSLYITLKDKKQNIILQNYPAIDLNDSTNLNTFRLRIFNYKDIDLNSSYWVQMDFSIFSGATVFNFNFYLA